MADASSREEVFNTLKEALKKDKCKTNILRISELGLIQMTRKRNRESLKRLLTERCFYCEGAGSLKSRRTICYEIFRKITRDSSSYMTNGIQVLVHPEIGEMLLKEESSFVELLERQIEKEIIIEPRPEFHLEQFDINYIHLDKEKSQQREIRGG